MATNAAIDIAGGLAAIATSGSGADLLDGTVDTDAMADEAITEDKIDGAYRGYVLARALMGV